MIQKKFITPLFEIPFTVIIHDNDKEIEEKFKDVPFEHPIGSWDGGVFEWKDHFYLVMSREKKGTPTPGVIAHESKHLVNRVFKYIGIDLDLQNDEPECYLLMWIVDQIHNFINQQSNQKPKNKQK